MANLAYFNDLTQWKQLPIDFITIYDSNNDDYVFRQLESNSKFSLEPIRRQDSNGGFRIVAWKLTIEAIVIQNNYGDMNTDEVFKKIVEGEINNVLLTLKADVDQANPGLMNIGGTGTDDVHYANWSVDFSIESEGESPALRIMCNGLFSNDIIHKQTTQQKFLYQLWSS